MEVQALTLSLRQRHQSLSARGADGDVSPQERESMVRDLVQAGAEIPAGADRDSLRNMLFYWAGEQSSRGERDRAMRAPALLPSAPLVSTMIRVDGPASAATQAMAAPPLAIVAAEPDPDPDAEARQIVRLAALARQWRLSDEGHRNGYLIADSATLAEAARYVDQDPDIRSLVEASRQAIASAAAARRRWAAVLAGLLVVAMLATLVALLVFLTQAKAENDILLKAEAKRRGEVQRSQDEAHAALDALRNDDLSKLRAFLAKQGQADPAVLQRLEVRKASSLEQVSDAAPGRAGPPVATPLPAPTAANQAPSCPGYLWFGAKGSGSLIEDKRDPATLRAGEVVKLDSSIRGIWLRQTLPLPGYVMGKQIGIVPAGALVTTTGEVRLYDRGNAIQVFAPVSVARAFCTTVFLQYVGPVDRRDAVLANLDALQVQTPPGEHVDTAAKLAEVRYFWGDDKPMAEQIAAQLSACNAAVALKVAALTSFPNRPSPGTIEVWLDLTRQGCKAPAP